MKKVWFLFLFSFLISAVVGCVYVLTPKTGPNLTLEAFGGSGLEKVHTWPESAPQVKPGLILRTLERGELWINR